MPKISMKYKIYIYSSVFLAGILAFIILLIFPYYQNITSLNNDIYDNRLQLAIYLQQRENIEKTRQEYNKIKSDINKISKIYASEENIVELISFFESTATNNNLNQTIDLQGTANDEIGKKIKFGIHLQGSWTDILNYLSFLEQNDYYILINDLFFKQNSDSLSATFVAAIYFD